MWKQLGTLLLWRFQEEEEMPDVEIDIDDLLDAANEEERALKLQETLVDCYKPTEEKYLMEQHPTGIQNSLEEFKHEVWPNDLS
ncbi:protein phosphatase 1 regulatory subunit 14C isoform X2 [Alligator sinensis]|uniref:Protein phosphatase 1 regulatory subunit 14C isoform X2 n=1 Tax=Alligator sinensis TaxID=38654 RepID=A0A3Q0HAW2_ALLSI|nr:protein phosphatase 1 regulatory subunit 14C isoform X2 [Alligator sinensis]